VDPVLVLPGHSNLGWSRTAAAGAAAGAAGAGAAGIAAGGAVEVVAGDGAAEDHHTVGRTGVGHNLDYTAGYRRSHPVEGNRLGCSRLGCSNLGLNLVDCYPS
jgi:hypothetical protein